MFKLIYTMPISEPVVAGGMQNGFDASRTEQLTPRERSLVTRRQNVLGTAYKLMYEHPVEFVRAEGVKMYDAEGNEYLDCYNNVVSVGHCNKQVVDAVTKQLGTLNTHTRYLSEPILDYTEQLLSTFEPSLSNAMFTCTGSEAVDLALRIAKFHTKGTGIIVTEYAYHGITAQVAAISSSMGEFTPLDRDVRTVRPPYAYRANPGEDVGERLASDIEEAIKDMQRHGIKFAGFIADSIFSTDGLLTDPVGFLQPAIAKVHEYGGLYIADEVQPGFGRTGSKFWGYQRHGIEPDIVVMGKPMGNGMPIAAVVTRPEFLEDFGNKARYFNTFGGNPVSIAAAQATLDIIMGGARVNSEKIGAYTLNGFKNLMEKYPQIGDVRGAGMYFAVEYVKDRKTKEPDSELTRQVVSELRERRVLISSTGKLSNCLKIRPLIVFTKENADQLLREFDLTMEKLTNNRGSSTGIAHSTLTGRSAVVSVETATGVLERYFAISGDVAKLRGERDQNFFVHTPNQDYVLKFLHPSEDEEFSNFQTMMMHHISHHAPHIPTQKVVMPKIMTSGGTDSDLRVNVDGETRTVRLATYIQGTLMASAVPSVQQKFNLGAIAGEITQTLQTFHHIGQNHTLLWDIQHASNLRAYLEELKLTESKRAMLLRCIENFEERVKPKYPHMRRGVVHNDYNVDNLIVEESDPDIIVGVLDFGDAVYTPIVNDVGVGAVYQMGITGGELMEGALAFIRGYDSVFSLTGEEISLVFDCMLTRMFVRIVLHTWRSERFPENKEYILRTVDESWEHLSQMLANEEQYRAAINGLRSCAPE